MGPIGPIGPMGPMGGIMRSAGVPPADTAASGRRVLARHSLRHEGAGVGDRPSACEDAGALHCGESAGSDRLLYEAMQRALVLAVLAVFAVSTIAQEAARVEAPAPVQAAFGDFSADAIRADTRFLSSDLLEGRGPGTRGDALTTSYLAARLESIGLRPAGDNGTYFQNVSLLGVTTVEDKTALAWARKDG